MNVHILFDRLDFFSLAPLGLKIDCGAISGPSLRQGATVTIGQPQESQGVMIKERAVAPVNPSQPQRPDTTAFSSGNVGNGAIPSPQQILSLIASKYLNNLNPSTMEDFNGFARYMKEVREAIVLTVDDGMPGSLIITVECGSLEILNDLWQDYCTGNLGRVVQKYLVTEDVLKDLGLTELKLTTTINGSDYMDCQKYFTQGRYDLHDTSIIRCMQSSFKTLQ